jgi:uncharacterized protein
LQQLDDIFMSHNGAKEAKPHDSTQLPTMMAISGDAGNPLRGLSQIQGEHAALPPVHLWNPPFCGDIDMRIGADGLWYYMNSPIGRKPLFTLFSRILRKDGDRYYLVTPVEKCGIRVDDAPLFAIRMAVENPGPDQIISFETTTDDVVKVDADHPLRFAEELGTKGLKPYVLVRTNLEALVARSLYYDLVNVGAVAGGWFGVWSAGRFFHMQRAAEIGAT